MICMICDSMFVVGFVYDAALVHFVSSTADTGAVSR